MLKAGDILGFSGSSPVSDFINLGTYGIPRWSISHVGILAHAADGRLLLFESTTLDSLPDEISGKPFAGTQAHDPNKVVAAYPGKVYHYPLYRPLFDFEDRRLTDYLLGTIHTPYSEMAAFRSAGLGFSLLESLLRPEDMHAIFCSAWVAKALDEIGVFPTDDACRWNPNFLMRTLRRRSLMLRPRRLK